jgi:N-acetylglucosaminyl-diphospho-decaprenol L-rhamnosyltransferase
MSTQDITVVITSFKSDEKIKDCLNSINTNCKVLIIENSNDIEFKKRIEKEFSNVECILAGKNLGYGAANNIGLKKVTTKYALILNPDTFLESSTLDEFFKIVKTTKSFAIIGPYIQEYYEKEKKNGIHKVLTSFNEEAGLHKNVKPLVDLNLKIVENVKGFAMFLNLSEFKNIGFFDENFFIYFEEIDLCRRVVNANKKIYLAPNVKINHSGGQSHNDAINHEMELSRNWHWMWSTFHYYKKYDGFFVALIKIFNKFFSSILKLLFYFIIFNKTKSKIYYQRFSGIINSILGNKSWYRPKV